MSTRMEEHTSEVLTEQEAAVYDRQIRVWGVDAQRRLSKARVLVVGIYGVIAETCKNLVLAGVGSLTLMDDTPVTLDSAASNFLIYVDEINKEAKSVAQVCAEAVGDYNSMVRVQVEKGYILDKPGEFFDDFDIVILGRSSLDLKKKVNALCRSRPQRVAFYAVDVRNSCGSLFIDLQSCTYRSQKKDDDKEVEYTKKSCSLEDSLSVRWDSLPKRASKLFFAIRIVEEYEQKEDKQPGHLTTNDLPALLVFGTERLQAQGLAMSIAVENLLKKIAEAGTFELSPVCAIMGGILGQEVLKLLSCKGEPIKNLFFFDASDGKGMIEDVSP
ncbi:ubiquitin-like 1-activating enzyme E1 A [Marchantia polymorpha subsp. ruderalis]|uniref:THIF-type NAD/FAD binding fold domain-containing protein n=2 Tax=Marchantia polymorpha TaxID=3197 RepID=A0A176W7Q2_MARPO|nr:hypothetical protein AXG93_1617s1380 [Marchantia polymorpha subsp. ruderalis]PTQ37153.1 hypothetical protein MARPO_0059s0079 [Marchantia polymorpha]BBN14566.1 hypothetical protein Mp_6g12670 [Marchantia polymorpha subsp. ruderalis]|eukprot:PTQ37153.1 hypothetical protein MARPO_0059s0079 [Marchantia polymorpha]